MLPTILTLWRTLSGKARRKHCSRRRPGYRPLLEVLEDRAVPASLSYSTFLNGAVYASAVDSAGNIYVTGSSSSLPTTPGAFETSGSGAFVAKLNPTGTAVLYATYLGNGVASGGAAGTGIAVDSAGDAFVIGRNINVPTTPNALATLGRVFVAELNPTGSALVYSTYLPGAVTYPLTFGYSGAIAVDGSGNIDVVGSAEAGFPVTAGAFQTAYLGQAAFFAKINPALRIGVLAVRHLPRRQQSRGSGIGHCSRQRRQRLRDRQNLLDQFPDDQWSVPGDLWRRRVGRLRGEVQSHALRTGIAGLLHLPWRQRIRRVRRVKHCRGPGHRRRQYRAANRWRDRRGQ